MSEHISWKRQDRSRAGFFDLPAELRLRIYELFCDLIAPIWQRSDIRTDQDTLILPYDEASKAHWNRYEQDLVKAKLICRQFRQEFIPLWATVSIFEIRRPPPNGHADHLIRFRKPSLDSLWFTVRDFLNEVGPLARPYVRNVKIRCDSYVPPFVSCGTHWACLCSKHEAILRHTTGIRLQDSFTDLLDVPRDLKIDVELVCIKAIATCNAAKRTFALRQNSSSVGHGSPSSWNCTVGQIQVWKPCPDVCSGRETLMESVSYYGYHIALNNRWQEEVFDEDNMRTCQG